MSEKIFKQQPFVGRADVVRHFGDVVVRDGEIVEPLGWESRHMTKLAELPGWKPKRGIYLAQVIVEPTIVLFDRWQKLEAAGVHFEIKSVGFFAPREKRGLPGVLSLHTYAIAFDVNAADNPMQERGAKLRTTIPLPYIAAAKAIGWTWGGEFSRPDPMHFQWASGV